MDKVPIPSHLVVKIIEYEGKDNIDLILKNGITVKTFKKLFKHYESYKHSVRTSRRGSTDSGRS